MTDKELRKLSREDLLEMLVTQSKEVERLKQEKVTLINQLKYYQSEFRKIGSLDAILIRMGCQPAVNTITVESALDVLLREYESEDSTSEIFENDETIDSEGEATDEKKKQTKKKPDTQSRIKEALDWTKMQFDRKK
jgi:phosphopentomutase